MRQISKAGSFESIYAEIQAITAGGEEAQKAKGDAFEDVVKWFLMSDPVYGLVDGDIRLWGDTPVGRDGQGRSWRWHEQDTGTDLLAYPANGTEGQLVAIQAKGWARDNRVTKSEVDSFLADSNRPEVHSRIFATTAAHINTNAERTVSGQEKPVTLVTYEILAAAPVVWPSSLAELRKTVRGGKQNKHHKPATLRPYQKKVVADAFKHLATDSPRGTVVMACGTGKTLTAQRLTEKLQPQTALLLFPSLMLLKQTLGSWLMNRNPKTPEFNWLAVCSDESVGSKGDDRVATRVIDLGIPAVTTDPEHIRKFLEGDEDTRPRVIFSTYQSSPQIERALKNTGISFDLILADEAHRMALVDKNNSIDGRNSFTVALYDEHIPAKKRVFLTATPRVYGGQIKGYVKGTDQEKLVHSMDDKSLFGEVIANYTFKQAIDGVGSSNGPVLANYEVLGVVVTDKDLAEMLHNRDSAAVSKQDGSVIDITDSTTLATQIAVLKAMEHPDYGITSLISYHHTIKNAEEFQSTHNEYRKALGFDGIKTDIVRGSDPAADRPKKLRILSKSKEAGASKALVSNARCLTEGIDVPLLDGVAFVDPKNSLVDIVQAVGRAIRLPHGSGKTTGFVVVPIYLNDKLVEALKAVDEKLIESGNYEDLFSDEILEVCAAEDLESELNQAFGPVIEVLRNLRSMDDSLTERIQKLKTSKGARSVRSKDRDIVPLGETGSVDEAEDGLHITIIGGGAGGYTPAGDSVSLGQKGLSLESVHGAVRLVALNRVLDRSIENWWDRYGAAVRFYDENGRWPSTVEKGLNERSLGLWVGTQRTSHRKGILSVNRVATLEATAGWMWNPADETWQQQYRSAVAFHAATGRWPRQDAADVLERPSGIWINSQRALHRKGKLSRERVAILNATPGWFWEVDLNQKWEESYEKAVAHYNKVGRWPRASERSAEGDSIGTWVATQHRAHKRGKLPTERASKLAETPGWEWEVRSQQWEEILAKSLAHYNKVGRWPRDGANDPEERPLGKWVQIQRAAKSSGNLSQERDTLLDQTPGWIWAIDRASDWEERLAGVVRLYSTTGRWASKASDDTEERSYGQWISRQRAVYKRGKLSAERIAQLETIEGWSWGKTS